MSGVWGPTRPELDRSPPLADANPAVTYVICSTPRSGSGLLCRGLAAAGAGGVPAEYLNVHQRTPLAERWGCGPQIADYAHALRRYRTDEAGTFGVKVHWDQLEALCDEQRAQGTPTAPAELLEQLFPGAVYVHILRLDLTAQAVSLWRAKNSGVWSERIDSPSVKRRTPRYSFRGIRESRQEIAEQEAGWIRCFQRAGISPIEVIYEELAAAYGAESARVLTEIGVTPLQIAAQPDGRRQADAQSAQLAARYERDAERHRHPSVASRAIRRLRRVAP